MTSDTSLSKKDLTTNSTATLGNISEAASLYSNSHQDIDSLSLSSNSGGTATSSSSSFKTINTTLYRMGDSYPISYPELTAKKQAILAEAEDIDDIDDIIEHSISGEDVEYMDNENLNESVNGISTKGTEIENKKNDLNKENISNNEKIIESNLSSDFLNKRINDIKHSFSSPLSLMDPEKSTILTPEERVSNKAKEYWATLDLYNNSKVAFNKRSKSVRLKREKLNNEWQSRFNQTPQKGTPVSKLSKLDETPQQKHDPETCKCVRCSIVYHETLIKSVSDMKASICRKCSNKNIACKCCSSSISSISFSEASSSSSITSDKKQTDASFKSSEDLKQSNENLEGSSPLSKKTNEFNQFEEKLFNIKNELVNLSETSLDVFQLLLQLSDTMLELNSQLNASDSLSGSTKNSSQLLFINQLLSSNLSLNENFSLTNTNTHQSDSKNTDYELEIMKTTGKSHNRRIEDFLQKTLNSVQSSSNTNSSVMNLNYTTNSQLKNQSHRTQIDSILSERKTNSNYHNNTHIRKQVITDNLKNQQSDNPIENLYDKTSVTQFVDSFFNNSKSFNEVNKRNAGYYSLLTTLNKNNHFSDSDFIVDENPYHSIDDELMKKIENFEKNSKPNSSTKYQVLKNTSKHASTDSVSIISDALSISSTQSSSLNRSNSQQQAQEKLTKENSNSSNKQTTETNSSSSSSSTTGCIEGTGSSSISSSSNIDLSSLPSTSSSSTNITNETSHLTSSATASSLILNESQTINRRIRQNNDYNKVTDNLVQSYRHSVNPSDVKTNNSESHIVSNIKSDTKKSTIPELPLAENSIAQNLQNDPIYGSATQYNQRSNSYRATTNLKQTSRKPSFKFDSTILNRVQTMGLDKTRHESIDEADSHKPATAANYLIRMGDKSNHQISLDSGIYLPSECEENNYNSIVRS